MNSFSKQEYIHLHGLLSEIADYMQKHEDSSYDMEDLEKYQEYLELGVNPTSIHKRKSDHRKAIFQLSDSINEFLEGEDNLQVES
ncbi:MAG: UPF0058 family protein [Candidatus Nanohalobium sp.]